MLAIIPLLQKLPHSVIILLIGLFYLLFSISFVFLIEFIALKISALLKRKPNINKKSFLIFGISQGIIQFLIIGGLLFAEYKKKIQLGPDLNKLLIFALVSLITTTLTLTIIKKIITKSTIQSNDIISGGIFVIIQNLAMFAILHIGGFALIPVALTIPVGLYLASRI